MLLGHMKGSYVLILAQGVRKDLVKRLSEQENLITASFEFLNEDAPLDLLGGLSGVGHVEYLSLSFPLVLHVLGMVSAIPTGIAEHTTHLIESDVLPLSGLETDKVHESVPVLGILDGTELEDHPVVLRDQSPLLGVFGCQLVEQDQEVSQNDTPHLLDEFGGLQSLTRDIEREVVGVDDNSNPAGPLGESVGTKLGSDEDVFDHESDILLFQWAGLLPVGILAVEWVSATSQRQRAESTNIFSGRKMIPLKEVPAASPEK
jgi:hypothetical protein